MRATDGGRNGRNGRRAQVPPYLAIHRYQTALLRHPAFPPLLFQNPKLMVSFHQNTRDTLVR
eukprot:COSAG01_NODE_3514_length_5982_cov_5.029917_2_plen_62_part_00